MHYSPIGNDEVSVEGRVANVRVLVERCGAGTEAVQSLPRARILRLIDSCITQFKAQGPSRTCYESKEEAVLVECCGAGAKAVQSHPARESSLVRIHFIIVMIRWTGLAP